MRRTLGILLALVVVGIACEDPVGFVLDPDALRLAVIDGQGQADTVLADLDTVKVQLTQMPDGSVSMLRFIGPAPLHAQGTPAAGILVCWDVENEDWGRVVPVCDETDAEGVAIGLPKLGTLAVDSAFAVGYADVDGAVSAVDTLFWSTLAGTPTSIVLDRDSAVVTLGVKHLMRDHLESATDAYGNPVALNALSLSAEAPFTLTGRDTVTATQEGAGWVRVTGGAARDSIMGLALVDLNAGSWELSYACALTTYPDGGVIRDADSMALYVVTDLAERDMVYDTLGMRSFKMRGNGTRTIYWSDNTSSVIPLDDYLVRVWRLPGVLYYAGWSDALAATADGPVPTRFDGGDRCYGTDGISRAAVLTLLP